MQDDFGKGTAFNSGAEQASREAMAAAMDRAHSNDPVAEMKAAHEAWERDAQYEEDHTQLQVIRTTAMANLPTGHVHAGATLMDSVGDGHNGLWAHDGVARMGQHGTMIRSCMSFHADPAPHSKPTLLCPGYYPDPPPPPQPRPPGYTKPHCPPPRPPTPPPPLSAEAAGASGDRGTDAVQPASVGPPEHRAEAATGAATGSRNAPRFVGSTTAALAAAQAKAEAAEQRAVVAELAADMAAQAAAAGSAYTYEGGNDAAEGGNISDEGGGGQRGADTDGLEELQEEPLVALFVLIGLGALCYFGCRAAGCPAAAMCPRMLRFAAPASTMDDGAPIGRSERRGFAFGNNNNNDEKHGEYTVAFGDGFDDIEIETGGLMAASEDKKKKKKKKKRAAEYDL